MKLTSQGDTLWTKIFYGSPDQYENASSVEVNALGHYIVGVSTASYPTVGFVPNKNAVVEFDSNGNLLFANLLNDGASHYSRISSCADHTILMSAFSNKYGGPIGFQSLLIKLDSSNRSGCFDQDVTTSTYVGSKPFKVTQPVPSLYSGATLTTNLTTFTTTIADTSLCSYFTTPQTSFTYSDTCQKDSVLFQTAGVSGEQILWDFGDGSTDTLATVKHHYSLAGNYLVTLIISNGCDGDTAIKTVQINAVPDALMLGNDTSICESQAIQLQSNLIGNPLLWNTGDTTLNIPIQTAGTYWLQVNTGACGIIRDTIQIETHPCVDSSASCSVFMANAFSPNGDQLNDDIGIRGLPNGATFVTLEIRNRWGNLCFSTHDISQRWDGKINGIDAVADTYYYFIKLNCQDLPTIIKGDILLIR